MRIFVDVDDTLVLYDKAGPNPYGLYMGTPYTPNYRLISGLSAHKQEHPDDDIILWSGGGSDYAYYWAVRLGIDYMVTVSLDKVGMNFTLIEDDSIVIDDQELGGRRTHAPDQWPERKCQCDPPGSGEEYCLGDCNVP